MSISMIVGVVCAVKSNHFVSVNLHFDKVGIEDYALHNRCKVYVGVSVGGCTPHNLHILKT